MSDRLITDNVLVAFESMHCLNQKKKGKTEEMALKLDMSKAFDQVEGGYLQDIMKKMGFNDSWVTLMMQVVNSVTYSIKLNRKPRGHITPTRVLQQGDPYPPSFFCFVQRDYQLFYTKPHHLDYFGEWPLAHKDLGSHTFSSPMTVSFSTKQLERNAAN